MTAPRSTPNFLGRELIGEELVHLRVFRIGGRVVNCDAVTLLVFTVVDVVDM
jgi:hypothetical protein